MGALRLAIQEIEKLNFGRKDSRVLRLLRRERCRCRRCGGVAQGLIRSCQSRPPDSPCTKRARSPLVGSVLFCLDGRQSGQRREVCFLRIARYPPAASQIATAKNSVNAGRHRRTYRQEPGHKGGVGGALKEARHRRREDAPGGRITCVPAELPGVALSAFEHRLDRTARTYLSFIGAPTAGMPRAESHRAGIPSALHRRGAAP
jgi:hypothetical protein